MPTSKDQLFEKIDHLLIDINAKYLELKSLDNIDKAELTLLSGSIDYLSSHIKALRYVQDEEATYAEHKSVVSPVREQVSQEIVFTPDINLQEKEADQQVTFDEIPVAARQDSDEIMVAAQEEVSVEETPVAPIENTFETPTETSFVAPAEPTPVVSTVVEEEKVVSVEEHKIEETEVTLEEVASQIEQLAEEEEAPSK